MAENDIAAIDLGSNSFHMIVTRVVGGNLQTIDRMKEMVQLADGLSDDRKLSKEARQRGLDCLALFGERLAQLAPGQVRAVATNTLRQARNGTAFLSKAEEVLGHPIEVISGMEEARLIYLGVSHTVAESSGRRLAIDIGGGSTELIIGEKFDPLLMESLHMGCVSISQRYFQEPAIRPIDLHAAGLAVRLELQPFVAAFERLGWETAIGASGSIRAIRDIVVGEGWCREGIDHIAMERLREELLGHRGADLCHRWQLSDRRAAVFAGGFTVLLGIFRAFDLKQLKVADGALREGVVYDLLGRIQHEDVRERTIALLRQRYTIDASHAEHVVISARQLLAQCKSEWDLHEDRYEQDLEWAAWLHEIGLGIAHSQYHKHGAYVLEHSDLPGFSRSEQRLLAILVRCHRRKFSSSVIGKLPPALQQPAQQLCILLRVAVLLHRSRKQTLPEFQVRVKKRHLKISFPPGWLESQPLTMADLESEQNYLRKVSFKLSVS